MCLVNANMNLPDLFAYICLERLATSSRFKPNPIVLVGCDLYDRYSVYTFVTFDPFRPRRSKHVLGCFGDVKFLVSACSYVFIVS